MNFLFGRTNLALTIFVPYDCKNKCPFCISKERYRKVNPSVNNVLFQIERVFGRFNYPIRDVVITGGEPMANLNSLKKIIDLVPGNMSVFINTTLIKDGLDEFAAYVNSNAKIKGINISRHGETYMQDCKTMCDIAEDDEVCKIDKPVRINCVIGNQDLLAIARRWNRPNVEVSFRKDFTVKQTPEELHNPYDDTALKLINAGFKFLSHTQCNVCDTTRFEREGQVVQHHKGKKDTSIKRGNTIEINDLIIFQDGRFSYDWEKCDLAVVEALESAYRKIGLLDILGATSRPVIYAPSTEPQYGCSAGSTGGCGGGC